MSVAINFTGELVLDQTAGLQGDDVNVDATGAVLSGDLDSDFLAFLNTQGLNAAQAGFAANVEGASDSDLVTITADAGETIGKLFFSDSVGEDFDGDLVPGVTLADGSPLYFWSADNGKVVLIKDAGGNVAAALYIEPTNAAHTTAVVQTVTFAPLFHADPNDPNDVVDFSDVLRVSAVITQNAGDHIGVADDAPTIVTSGTPPEVTVDETVLATDATESFAANFTSDFGTDGAGSLTYALGVSSSGADSGIVDTATNQSVLLSLNAGVVEGRTSATNDLVFTVSVDAFANVTLDQLRAVVHPDALDPDDSITLAAASLVTLTGTIVDADGDSANAVLDIGQNLNFEDDGPSITASGTPPTLTVDESDFATDATQSFAGLFTPVAGADGDAVTYALGINAGAANLIDTQTGQAITLSVVAGQVLGKDSDGDLVFSVSVAANGDVTLNQLRAVSHPDTADPNDVDTLATANLITLTATVTDKDGDQASTAINIANTLHFIDDAPAIIVPVDYPGADTSLHVGNAVGQSRTGSFGYDIGHDTHPAAFYTGGGSDFVDQSVAAGIQIGLTGTVGAAASPITNAVVTLSSESESSAAFNFSFHYDKDPITAGVQDATAGGTLTLDKVADTFTVAINDVVDGFDFSVLHTNELLAKQPTGNTGHPNIVVEQLAVDNPATAGVNEGFYVQFTADNSPFGFSANGQGGNTADKAFTGANHDMVGGTPTWVSATQSTNGVAGDTIQSGENLTLRFFNENILADVAANVEKTVPTDSVSGVALKFDGIGANEDLVIVLDLIDTVTHQTITRSVTVENGDLYKNSTPGGVPAPYNSEFSLDNNDGLLIIEANDYNAAGEHYEIQGMQIMQSANGLTGSGINLNKAIGIAGGSNATSSLQAWNFAGSHTTDVLKITDIGFVEQTSGTLDANLDFAFQLHDADGDVTAIQHIAATVSNDFII